MKFCCLAMDDGYNCFALDWFHTSVIARVERHRDKEKKTIFDDIRDKTMFIC